MARDAKAECAQVFDRFRSSFAAHLTQIGLHETAEAARARDASGLEACAKLPDAKRTCLLDAPATPAAWTTCAVEPPFTLFDGTSAREALLGKPLDPTDAATRIAPLVGAWHQPAKGLDDAVTWKINAGGTLAIRRVPKKGKPNEMTKQIELARERLLAIKTGTSTQFVPVFPTADRLYMSWTSGALAIPIANEDRFALALADGGRWIVWAKPSCTLLDPRLGASDVTCAFEDAGGERAFVVGTTPPMRWALRDGALVHPAMETLKRQR